jgi:peptide chain release factor 1
MIMRIIFICFFLSPFLKYLYADQKCSPFFSFISHSEHEKKIITKLEQLIIDCNKRILDCNQIPVMRRIEAELNSLRAEDQSLQENINYLFELRRTEPGSVADISELEASLNSTKRALHNRYRDLKGSLVKLLDPYSNKKSVLTISPQTGKGGPDSKIVAFQYFQYIKELCRKKGWTIENINDLQITSDGRENYLDTIHLTISGKDTAEIRRILQHENGIHIFQRNKGNKNKGDVFTNRVDVRLAPEISNVDITINEDEVNFSASRSGGKGGQNVNKVSSAVRLTHIPTGISVKSQLTRDQFKNRQDAMRKLSAEVAEYYSQKTSQELEDARSKLPFDNVRTYDLVSKLVRPNKKHLPGLKESPIANLKYDADSFLRGDVFTPDNPDYLEYMEHLDDIALNRLLK